MLQSDSSGETNGADLRGPLPEISVVLPALNEGGNIGRVLERLHQTLRGITRSYEIIVIDGGSSDETRSVAVKHGARCVLQSSPGYGGALREGFMLSRGRSIVTLDCDLSHPPELITELWRFRESADVVVASRFIAGGSSRAPRFRHLLSIAINRIFSSLLSLPLKDLSSGYRLYRRAVLSPTLYEQVNFDILQEIIVRAYSDGYRVHEVPLQYEQRATGKSHVSLLRFALSYPRTLFGLWKLRNRPEAADYEARAYRSRHLLQRYWVRQRLSSIEGFLDPTRATLDIGAGSCRLPGIATRVAFDIVVAKLRYQRGERASCVNGSCEHLPFADAAFAQVVCSQVLPFVSNVDAVLKEIHRVQKKGGVLVVSVPDAGTLSWRIVGALYRQLPNTRGATPLRTFTRESLTELLVKHGYSVQKVAYICGAELVVSAQKK